PGSASTTRRSRGERFHGASSMRRARVPRDPPASTMDARSIAILEFPLVRERLAERTSFLPSRRLAEQLVPQSDPVLVARGLDETDEARGLVEERAGVGIGGARDIGPAIDRAARGGRLDPEQFLDVWATLDAA